MLSRNHIKYLRSLKLKRFREIHKQFLAEGDKIVRDLIRNNKVTIRQLIATDTWLKENQVIFSPRGYASTRGVVYIIPSGNLKDAYNGNRKGVSLEAVSGKTVIWNYSEGLEEKGECPWREDGK